MKLPDFDNCNFIKKSSITSGDRTEKVLIYRLKDSPDFHYAFVCPACGEDNDFPGGLESRKEKVNGKNKEFYRFSCSKCHGEFGIERLRPGRGSKAA